MKEFALIFRLSDVADTRPTPEQIQERLNWLAGIAAQNKLADKGKTLSVTTAATVKGGEVFTDGPYTEIKEFISGFVLVRTDTLGDALQLAKTNPILKIGGSVEVREVVQVYVQQTP